MGTVGDSYLLLVIPCNPSHPDPFAMEIATDLQCYICGKRAADWKIFLPLKDTETTLNSIEDGMWGLWSSSPVWSDTCKEKGMPERDKYILEWCIKPTIFGNVMYIWILDEVWSEFEFLEFIQLFKERNLIKRVMAEILRRGIDHNRITEI